MKEEYVNMVLPIDSKNEVIVVDVNDQKYKFFYKLDDFYQKIYNYRKNSKTKIIKISFSNFYINEKSKNVIEKFTLKDQDNNTLKNRITIFNVNVDACNECMNSDQFKIYNEVEQKLIRLGRIISSNTVETLKKYLDEEHIDEETKNGLVKAIIEASEEVRKQMEDESDEEIIDIEEDSRIKKIALNMLNGGYSYQEISDLTKLSIEEIEQLEEE